MTQYECAGDRERTHAPAIERTPARSIARQFGILALAALGASLAWVQPARAETGYLLDAAHRLHRFDTAPGGPPVVGTIGTLSGLAGPDAPTPEAILGMDVRPRTGQLYALSNRGHLYLVDANNAQVRRVHTFTEADVFTGVTALDVDPRADQLRVIGAAGQNFLISFDTFAVTEQTVLSGVNPASLAGLAYARNVAGTDRTTMYVVDAGTDTLYRVGTLDDGTGASQAGGVATAVRALGIDVGAGSAGVEVTANGDTLFLAATVGGTSALYEVSPSSGATQRFAFPSPAVGEVRALAIYSFSQRMRVLLPGNRVSTVDTARPGFPSSEMPIAPPSLSTSGFLPDEEAILFDHIPGGNNEYLFTNRGRLHGVTSVSIAIPGLDPATVLDLDVDQNTFRAWFTDTAGRLIEVSFAGNTATIEGVTTLPGRLLTAIAYSVPKDGPRRLYGVDVVADQIVRIDGATVTPVADIGVPLAPTDAVGLEISDVDNSAFVAWPTPGGTGTMLSALDLSTGRFRALGAIYTGPEPTPATVRDITLESAGSIYTWSLRETIPESERFTTYNVIRLFGLNGPQEVRCTTSDQTAVAPGDYAAVEQSLIFEQGSSTGQQCTLTVVNDLVPETFNETLRFRAMPYFGRAGGGLERTVTIQDDDGATQPPVVTIATPTSEPTLNTTETSISLAGTAVDPDGLGLIASVRWATDRGFFGTAAGLGTWTIADVPLQAGVNTIVVYATDLDGEAANDTLTVTVTDPAADSRSYYLAEGATGPFFDLDLLLVNPTSRPAPITMTFLREGTSPVSLTETLAARSRRTLRVDEIDGLQDAQVSTVVTSTDGVPLVVERTMRWDASGYGAHTEKAADGLARQWYFAEGAQGFFRTYLLLANPNPVPIVASVEYLREGLPSVTRTYVVEAARRLTVDAGADSDLVDQAFGMVVSFSAPAAAERAMYFGESPLFAAGHESAGAVAPSPTWFLAEGATGPFFETFVLLTNPNDEDATAEVTFLPSVEAPVTRTVTVPARQRHTINIEVEDASLANEAVATRITSSLPIVVERAQYWPDPAPQWYEAHNSFGVTEAGTTWGLAEGRVGGPSAHQTYILLANPGLTDATVTITFLPEGGTPFEKSFVVAANRRFNVATGPGSDVPELVDVAFGAVIASTQPIVVERAMYADAHGQIWAAGTNATATRLP